MHSAPDRSSRRPLLVALLVVLVVAGVAGVVALARGRGPDPAPDAAGPPPPSVAGSLAGAAGTSAGRTTTPSATPSPDCGSWGGPLQRGLATAPRLVRTEPGQLGVTVLDRRPGAVWEAGTAGHLMCASSTPKLALATSLLERSRAGEIVLDATARQQMAAMLAVSDDDAADALWDRYGGASLLPRFRDRYGMSGATFVAGFPQRWGFIKVSSRDLRRLMTYVLTRTDPADRAYLVQAMRT